MLASDDKYRPLVGPSVGTVVYGDRAPEWEHWMLKSIKKAHPNVRYHRIQPDLCEASLVFGNLADRAMKGYFKAVLCNAIPGPIWVLDADTILLRPLRWQPPEPEVVMAAAPGGDEKYLGFLREAGIPLAEKKTINAGVLWLNADLRQLWQTFFRMLAPIVSPTPYPLGECVWNALWHDLRVRGKAELLPQEYNQIISEHGPYGATVFHLAGSPEHFRAQLMESYYKALLSPEV